jgi:hypothetical protein
MYNVNNNIVNINAANRNNVLRNNLLNLAGLGQCQQWLNNSSLQNTSI